MAVILRVILLFSPSRNPTTAAGDLCRARVSREISGDSLSSKTGLL